jgi:arsenite methyltransferase
LTDLNTTPPPALRRALELLADPPTNPDVSKGYLDLLGTQQVEDAAVPKNTSAIQAVFASLVGSMLYDNAQALSRRLLTAMQQPTEWLNIPPGGIALDVGCSRPRTHPPPNPPICAHTSAVPRTPTPPAPCSSRSPTS